MKYLLSKTELTELQLVLLSAVQPPGRAGGSFYRSLPKAQAGSLKPTLSQSRGPRAAAGPAAAQLSELHWQQMSFLHTGCPPARAKGTSWAITSHHAPRRDVKTAMGNVNRVRPRPGAGHAALTEMGSELQLVPLSFSGAPAN